MVSGASKRAPALEMSPIPERTWSCSITSWSAPSIRTIRGARSRNVLSMRVVHRSGGSNTCESEDRMSAEDMAFSFPGPARVRADMGLRANMEGPPVQFKLLFTDREWIG
jgi:hypothetical protein